MPIWKLETPGFELKVTMATLPPWDTAWVSSLMANLRDWKDTAPTTSVVSFVRDTVDLERYNYLIEESGGREWKQAIYLHTTGVWMTFDVTDQWKLSEFSRQRGLRDRLIEHVQTHGCTSIVAEWT